MAGPTANVSRSFWAIAKKYSYLLSQQGTPVFDASLNANSQALWWNRLMHGVINSGAYCVRVDGTTEALGVVSAAAAPAQDFRIGMLYGHMLSISSICEYMPDLTGGSRENYKAVTNYLFEGVVTSATGTKLTDTSKNFLTEHYLLVGPCRIYIVAGTNETGQYFDITAWTATTLDAASLDSGAGGVVAGDTYRVVPQELAAAGPSTDTVYAMIIQEDLDEIEDPDLEDPTTSLTQCHATQARVCWRMDEGTAGVFPAGAVGRVGYIPVATVVRDGTANIDDDMITNDPQGYFGPSIRAVSMQSLYGTGVSTVSVETRVTDLCEFEGPTGLFDAVDMYKDTTRTIYVKGNGVGGTAYTWAATLDVTGDLEIIVVGAECEIDNSTAGAYMLTTSGGGRVTIRGFGHESSGFTVTDAGGAGDVFNGEVSLENATIDGACILSGVISWVNSVCTGGVSITAVNLGPNIFDRCNFSAGAGLSAFTVTNGLGRTQFTNCLFDGTLGATVSGGGFQGTTAVLADVTFDTCSFYAKDAFQCFTLGTSGAPVAARNLLLRNCYMRIDDAYGAASSLGRGLNLNVDMSGVAVDGLRIFVAHASDIRTPLLSVYHEPTEPEELILRNVQIEGQSNLTDLNPDIGLIRLVCSTAGGVVAGITMDGLDITKIYGEASAAAGTNAILVRTQATNVAVIHLKRMRFEYTGTWGADNKTHYIVYHADGTLKMTDCHLNGANTTTLTAADLYGVYNASDDVCELHNCYIGGFEFADFYNSITAAKLIITGCRSTGRAVKESGPRWFLNDTLDAIMTGCHLDYTSWDAGKEPVVEVGAATAGSAIITNNRVIAAQADVLLEAINLVPSGAGCVCAHNNGVGIIEFKNAQAPIGCASGTILDTNTGLSSNGT